MNTAIMHHHQDDSVWSTNNLAELAPLPTPLPTESYSPITHYNFAREILNLVDGAVESQHYMLTNEGRRLFGRFVLAPEHNLWQGKAQTIIFRNSHDKSVSAFVGGGSFTFICTNLAAHATYSIRTRHTGDVWVRILTQLPTLLANLGVAAQQQTRRLEQYTAKRLTYSAGESVIVEAARRSIIPLAHIVDVADEWRNPSYEYEAVPVRSAGALYEAFTATALHDATAPRNVGRTLQLNELIDEVIGAPITSSVRR